MKLIWVIFIADVIINITLATSLRDKVLKKYIVESDGSKPSTPTSYAITRRRSISRFPNMPHKENNFVINFNPTMKPVRYRQLEIYRKPFMKKLLIKDINNKDNFKATTEVTARRSLMQGKNFTERLHDVYPNTIYSKYNWNKNNSTYNFEKSKSETDITKEKFQPGSEEKDSEEETQNLNRDDTSINDDDFADFEKEHINNTTHTHDYVGLRKSKTLLLLPKRNNLNYLKENTLKLGSENKTSSNTVNDQNSNVIFFEDKDDTTITPVVIIKLDAKDQLEEVKQPKENTSDQEKKNREGFINVKEVNQNVMSNAKHDLSGNFVKRIRQRFRFYRFMRNKM